jgi:lia operon protein LiaG
VVGGSPLGASGHRTTSGDIETDFSVSVTRHARDHLTGRIGDGRGKIAIETGSGGIKLVKGR